MNLYGTQSSFVDALNLKLVMVTKNALKNHYHDDILDFVNE